MPTNAELNVKLDDLTTLIKDSVKTLTNANKATKDELSAKLDDLSAKVDDFDAKLTAHDVRIERTENQIGELEAKVDNSNDSHKMALQTLSDRVSKMDEKLAPFENLTQILQELKEEGEEHKNRQLRETLIFKNIPEDGDETFDDTREILATIISETCDTIDYDTAFNEINRAHREKIPKNPPQNRPSRAGKRHIFVSFHSWYICQTIIKAFRKKRASDGDFDIFAEQMYGQLTMKRRSMALLARKQLKAQGTITGGYVDYPAKLFVNLTGNNNAQGHKVYTFHSDFSRREVATNAT